MTLLVYFILHIPIPGLLFVYFQIPIFSLSNCILKIWALTLFEVIRKEIEVALSLLLIIDQLLNLVIGNTEQPEAINQKYALRANIFGEK